MASTPETDGLSLEECPRCSVRTPHDAWVEIRTEGDGDAGHSRQPYRVSTCQHCGHEAAVRVDAVSSR